MSLYRQVLLAHGREFLHRMDTRTKACPSEAWWYGIWEGWGISEFQDGNWPKFVGPGGERFVLLRGGAGLAHRLAFQGRWVAPSAWWPNDKRWFVGTEIDDYSSYVGADRKCLDALRRTEGIEALTTNFGSFVVRSGEWLNT